MTTDWPPGRFLEVGAGTGEISQEFLEREFQGVLFDLGSETRQHLRERFSGAAGAVVIDDLSEVPDQSLDYLFAFEVLEHIAADHQALCAWRAKLRRGGRVLLSVPAHQRKFSATDERVGHVRRYERGQLESLLASAGFDQIQILCYGFPLGNLSRTLGNWLESRKMEHHPSGVERSVTSGMEQSGPVLRLSQLTRPWMYWPFLVAQSLAFETELGDGYVATARVNVD